jgi:hypothetical protein
MTEPSHHAPTGPDSFPDAGRVVEAFGGVRPMAARLGIAATTIQGWKSRGKVPHARRQEVRDAAQVAGIDLSEIGTPDDARPGDDFAGAAVAAPAARPARGIAWLALLVAVAAGVAVATQALWSARQAGDASHAPAVDGLVARVAVLEAAPAPDPGPLAARVGAIEAAIASLRETAARREPATPDLTPRLDALAVQRNQDRDRLGSMMERLESLSAAARTEDQSKSAARAASAAELGSIRAELAALRTRLDDAAGADASVNAAAASLVLAVAALADAVTSGAPFTAPLSVIERFAENDAALAELIAPLAPHAAKGIPTQARLARDFRRVATRLSAPLWPRTGVPWIDGVLEKVDSLVTIRRLEDAEGKALPVVRVERALDDNDLARAIAALAGASGPGAAWASRAKSRVAADRAMAGLRLRAIEALGAGQPAARAR